MEFVSLDNDPRPHILYRPYIYSKVYDFSKFYLILEKDRYKVVWKTDEQLKLERDGIMRDPERIQPFVDKLGTLWKNNCPDWRFGQLIENVFTSIPYNIWMLEDDHMIEEFENFFKEEQRKLKKGGKKHGQKRGQGKK